MYLIKFDNNYNKKVSSHLEQNNSGHSIKTVAKALTLSYDSCNKLYCPFN